MGNGNGIRAPPFFRMMEDIEEHFFYESFKAFTIIIWQNK